MLYLQPTILELEHQRTHMNTLYTGFKITLLNNERRTIILTCSVLSILTGKRNATVEFVKLRRVIHKHELHKLTVTRTLSKASGLLEVVDLCLSDMLANIHEYFNCCHYTNFISF